VLRNFGINTVWFQNEGITPDISFIVSLCKRFTKMVILYDNDRAGIKAAANVTAFINSNFPLTTSPLSVPLSANVTDTSDFYKFKGKFELISFLTQHNLL
jgi:hypothetical protein